MFAETEAGAGVVVDFVVVDNSFVVEFVELCVVVAA